jgi:hypothetical protein
MNKAEFMLQDAEREVARVHEMLVAKADDLGDRMTQLALRLHREGVVASVNELGEVQGLGADVDRLCCLLHQTRRTRDLLQLAVRAAQEQR